MKVNNQTVKAAAAHVGYYLPSYLDDSFVYHDYSHTLDVVTAVEELCTQLNIEKHEKKLLLVAAWFHDIGYTRQIDNHETAGAVLAEEFLLSLDIDADDIAVVKSCILATHYPQKPVNQLQEILCDADMMHLGSKNFFEISHLLRKEWEQTKKLTYTDADWYALNISFLSSHRYHTSYGRKQAEHKKNKNIERLKKTLASITGDNNTDTDENNEAQPIVATVSKPKRNTERLERGVETLFRSASGNHMRLSGMADNKAHILLSINSIIISIILSVLAKKLGEAPFLVIPTILLLMVSAASIVFAVLTTKPKVSKGVFTKEQIINREANLLFFGNFHQMDLDIYEWGIREMMYDKDYLYKSMTKDIYFLGKVLATKYKYLNIGYRVFMYGILVSVVAYGISFLFAS